MRYLFLFLALLFSNSTVFSQTLIRNGEYLVISAVNEKVLDVSHEKKDNGTNILVYQHNGNDCQKFVLAFENNGVFTMRAKHSGKYVTVEKNSSKDLTNIVQWEQDGTNANKFTLEAVPESDMFMIVGVNSKKVLTVDPNSGNVLLMSKPDQSDKKDKDLNQYWRFSQRVRFENVKNSRMMDVPNSNKQDGTKLITYDNNTGKNQAFDLMPMPNSENYYIRSVASQKYLTINNNSTDAIKKLYQAGFVGNDSQVFSLEKVSDYTYYLRNTGKNLVLQLEKANGGNGTEIILNNKLAESSQQWRMINFDPNPTNTLKKEIKNELKETTEKTKDKIKDVGKKTKDKLKKLFK